MLAIGTVDGALNDGSDGIADGGFEAFAMPGLSPTVDAETAARAHAEILLALQIVEEPVRAAPPPPPPVVETVDARVDLLKPADTEPDPGDDPAAWHLPPAGIHTTGTQLRRRLVTPESIAALETARPTLLQRLLGRA